MLSFIIFEISAQAYLVTTFYSFKDKMANYINLKYLKLKIILVSLLYNPSSEPEVSSNDIKVS